MTKSKNYLTVTNTKVNLCLRIKLMFLKFRYLELTNFFALIRRMSSIKIILIKVVRNHMQQIGINAIMDSCTIDLKVSFEFIIY
jgi:hypothetical protein